MIPDLVPDGNSFIFFSNNKKKTNPNPNDNDINEKEEANHELKIIRPTKDVLYTQYGLPLYDVYINVHFIMSLFSIHMHIFGSLKVPDRQYNNKNNRKI